jgi:hypothetical protein
VCVLVRQWLSGADGDRPLNLPNSKSGQDQLNERRDFREILPTTLSGANVSIIGNATTIADLRSGSIFIDRRF